MSENLKITDSAELEVDATDENLSTVQEFVEARLETIGCSMKIMTQINVSVEEIFVNVAHYAYAPGKGTVIVRIEISEDPSAVSITFLDRGVPYNPLEKEDPDVTLTAEKRQIGGLGIYMTKKIMDEVAYEYQDGRNIFMMKKNL